MRSSRAPEVDDLSLPDEADLLPDDRLEVLLAEATAVHKMFLAALGRGLTPTAAAVRAGWSAAEAGRVAEFLLHSHPIVSPLVRHVLRLRELASLDGEEPLPASPPSVH
jgi:hypothetical protein